MGVVVLNVHAHGSCLYLILVPFYHKRLSNLAGC
jgi:hypothetical protein